MVPLALLFVLPLVSAGADMEMMKNMMNMMEMMNQAKGWGAKTTEAPAKADDWYNMQNSADYEAYLKWCEENRARQAEFVKQQELLNEFKAREEARKMEMEKERAKMEAEERQKNMMAEWKMWEKKMQMTASFDSLGYEIMEMKHKYYYMVTFEFLKFCKCSDFTAEIERFFMHDGVSTKYEEFELSDLGAIDSTDPNAVAQKFITLSKGDQIKAFFGGLAEAMCGGARTYFEQVEAWEKQYNFLERLV